MDQKDRDNRGRRTGYRKLAWVAAVLTIFPLLPMAVGSLFPGTRRFLGGVGVVASSFLLFAGFVVALIVVASGSEDAANQADTPIISGDVQAIVITQIGGDPVVRDAAITQRGDDISLVLIVGYATSEAKAKSLGDNFVRLTKSLSQDTPPGRMIGRGIYNYLVGVYYPNEERLAKGAKVAFSDRISW